MLKYEAEWLGSRLQELDRSRLSPLLNVGSASGEFRRVAQPWIDESIFGPLREQGIDIKHQDFLADEGIDLAGDLTDPVFLASLRSHGFRSVMCCNVLEHVPDPGGLCAVLERLVPVGGYIVISVPRAFPYH